MDPTLITNEPVTWVVVAYFLVKEVLPKLFPELGKWINKRTTTEDRLFVLLEAESKSKVVLAEAIRDLTGAVNKIDARVVRMEQILSDSNAIAFNQWLQGLAKVAAREEDLT